LIFFRGRKESNTTTRTVGGKCEPTKKNCITKRGGTSTVFLFSKGAGKSSAATKRGGGWCFSRLPHPKCGGKKGKKGGFRGPALRKITLSGRDGKKTNEDLQIGRAGLTQYRKIPDVKLGLSCSTPLKSTWGWETEEEGVRRRRSFFAKRICEKTSLRKAFQRMGGKVKEISCQGEEVEKAVMGTSG